MFAEPEAERVRLLCVIACRGKIEARQRHPAGIKPGMDRSRLLKALEQQARAHQGNHCQRHFADHQRSLEPAGVKPRGAVSPSFLQRVVDVRACGVQGRADTSKKGNGESQTGSEEQDTGVELRFENRRRSHFGHEPAQRISEPARDHQTRSGTGQCEQQRLCQQLPETLLLALTGSAAGLMIASWLGDSLRWLMPKVASPAVLEPELDTSVLLFTAGLGFAVTLLAGIGPALNAARANVNDTLKEGGRHSAAGLHAHRLQGPLVVCEVALAVVALVGAGLLLKSFQQARA